MSDYLDKAILRLLAEPGTTSITALPPAPEAVPESTAAAIARCRAAWQRAFNDYVKKNAKRDSWVKDNAAKPAAIAYRAAMPPLVGHQGIRDFIACAAFGILIEAIPRDRASQLLYAAQVALSVVGALDRATLDRAALDRATLDRAAKAARTAVGTPPPPLENAVSQPESSVQPS